MPKYSRDDPSEVNTILEPYWEELEVDPYIYLTKEQLRKEFEGVKKEIREGKNKYLLEQNRQKGILTMSQEEFSEWYHGGIYDTEGNLLTTYNPDSKWDWHVIGGRWSNYLRLKNGERADYAQIKNIDFSPDKEAYHEALQFWEMHIEEGDSPEIAIYSREYYLELFGNKEEYADFEARFTLFALVHEGVWHEEGEMGLLGTSDTTRESRQEFIKFVDETLKAVDPDKYLVIVDCHI